MTGTDQSAIAVRRRATARAPSSVIGRPPATETQVATMSASGLRATVTGSARESVRGRRGSVMSENESAKKRGRGKGNV